MSASLPNSTLAILEKLQSQTSPHLARRDLAELAVLMRYAERGAWAFAVYNTVPVRDEVAGVLRELLTPLPVYEFTLSSQRPNPLDYLNDVPTDQKRAIVFFFDLEQTDGAVWKHLEMQRENLAARPLGLVFWINRQTWQEGVRWAPNFWSQRSGVFDFTIKSPATLAEVRSAWAGQPLRLESSDDWERQMRLFSGLLREYEAENAPPAIRAELHGKIANLLYFDGRPHEAIEHLQQQLALAQAANDRRQEANALRAIGDVHNFRKELNDALASYAQALQLFQAVGDRLGEANTRKAIGDVHNFRKELNDALASYAQALQLFQAVGDRLGEANTRKAIGDVHNFRRELDDALASYAQALDFFRQVGDRLGEANTLQAIGDVQRFRDEFDGALASYAQALDLFRQVGDRLGKANTLQAIGDVQRFRDEYDDALASYAQALDLFRQVGDRLGEANTRKAIGDVQRFRDEYDDALASYAQALNLFRQVGARLGEANTRKAIGDVHNFRRELDDALASYAQALDLFRQVGDRLGEANTLLTLAPFSENAEEVFGVALSLYETIGDQYSLARALYYYAQFLAAQGQTDKAIAALEQCRDKFLAIHLTDLAAAAQQAINELSAQ
jgi:tetratricopeptide (TPR) repeat protein